MRAGRDAVAASAGHPNRANYLTNLAQSLRVAVGRSGDPAQLAESVQLARDAVAEVPADHPNRGRCLAGLGAVLLACIDGGFIGADLDETIVVLREAVAALPEKGLHAVVAQSHLGAALRMRFDRTGTLADADEMVGACRAAVDVTPDDHPDSIRRRFVLAFSYYLRFAQTGELLDLTEAVRIAREVLAATPETDADRPERLTALGLALRSYFGRTGDAAALEEAVELVRQAEVVAPAGHPDRFMILSNLSYVLHDRYTVTGALDDLKEAARAAHEALAVAPSDGPRYAALLSILTSILLDQFEVTGIRVHLDEAVSAGRDGVSHTPADHPERAVRLSKLGDVLRARYASTGDSADLKQALDVCLKGLDIADEQAAQPVRALLLSNLGLTQEILFVCNGGSVRLDEAIRLGREAVAVTSTDNAERALFMSRLGGSLRLRHDLTGDRSDLDEAIGLGRDAVAATPAGRPGRALFLSNLGIAYYARFERSREVADLDEAIRLGREAVAATPAHRRQRVERLSNLAVALLEHAEQTGNAPNLDEAIALFREAAALTPAGNPYRGGLLSNLGIALHARFKRTADRADIDEAVRVSRDAVSAAPTDQPGRAGFLLNLVGMLRDRYSLVEDQHDLDEAMGVARQVASLEMAPPRIRTMAALAWAQTAAHSRRWSSAADGFALAVAQLTRLAPRSLAREDQEHLLGDLVGIGSNAAACCVRAGQPARAVELFEQGRAVLLGQALDTRTDVTALADRHPHLASRFTSVLDELDHAAETSHPERRRQATAAFDALVDEIRSHAGFETFLSPPSVAQLASAASDGPIAMVTVSDYGCYALILTADGVREPLQLPGLTFDVVTDQVLAFLTTLDDIAAAEAHGREWHQAQRRLDEILDWTWTTIAGPVLDDLGYTGHLQADQPWPRIWWCPTGILSLLPLHAAGRHGTRDDPEPATVVDRVISSYTPTVRALAYARRAPAAATRTDTRILAVSMPTTPHLPQGDLPGASKEVAQLRDRYGQEVTVIAGLEATRDAVMARLPTARWAHFACHGEVDVDRPSTSRLLLHDHDTRPFTVADVIRLRLETAEFAYLSACSTARPGAFLLDEAIHLTSAFQLAGFRHVVGTLWPVSDTEAAAIAGDVYAAIDISDCDIALAVHTAIRDARSRWDVSSWASHIHSGP